MWGYALGSAAPALAVLCGLTVWLVTLGQLDHAGGSAGDYGLAYRWQAAAAEALSSEGVLPQALEADRTRDRSIGVQYLLQHVCPPPDPIPGKRAVLIDNLLFPGLRCETGAGHEARWFGPLHVCVHEG